MDYPTTFVSDEDEENDELIYDENEEKNMEKKIENVSNNNNTKEVKVIEPFVKYKDGEGIYTFDDDDELDVNKKEYKDNHIYKVEIRNDNNNMNRKPQLLYNNKNVTFNDKDENDDEGYHQHHDGIFNSINFNANKNNSLSHIQRDRLLSGLKSFPNLPQPITFALLYLINNNKKIKLISSVTHLISISFFIDIIIKAAIKEREIEIPEIQQIEDARLELSILQQNEIKRERKIKMKEWEIEMERRKVIKEKRQKERRRKAQHAKKMKHEARHRRRNYLKTKRELDHKNRRYKVIFHKGPIGMGIDPPEGHKIGSIVTVLVENGQADNSSKIRIGDAVISINGVDITHLNHEDTYIELKYADRPMEIYFELAPYHPLNKEDQKPLEKVFDEILESQSIKGLNIDELQEALAKSHIHVKKEDIKYILIRVKNDIDRDELSFEEFLHYSYDLSDEAKERKRHSHEYNEAHRESDTSEDEDDNDSDSDDHLQESWENWEDATYDEDNHESEVDVWNKEKPYSQSLVYVKLKDSLRNRLGIKYLNDSIMVDIMENIIDVDANALLNNDKSKKDNKNIQYSKFLVYSELMFTSLKGKKGSCKIYNEEMKRLNRIYDLLELTYDEAFFEMKNNLKSQQDLLNLFERIIFNNDDEYFKNINNAKQSYKSYTGYKKRGANV